MSKFKSLFGGGADMPALPPPPPPLPTPEDPAVKANAKNKERLALAARGLAATQVSAPGLGDTTPNVQRKTLLGQGA